MAGFQMAQHSDKPPIYYVHELSTTQNNSCFVCDRCSFLIVFVIFLYYNFYIKKITPNTLAVYLYLGHSNPYYIYTLTKFVF